MTDTTRQPHDTEMERALIAAVLAENDALDKIGRLTPDDFFDPLNGAIFSAILNLREARRPINLVTLRTGMAGANVGEGTITDHLQSFAFGGTIPEANDMADSLLDLSMRRKAQDVAMKLADSVWDMGSPLGELISGSMGEIDELLGLVRGKQKTNFPIDDILEESARTMSSGEVDVHLSSGLKSLDRAIGGFRRGEYAILAGRPGMGKSLVSLAFAKNVARRNYGVMIFSLEMTRQQLGARIISEGVWSSTAKVPYVGILSNELSDYDRERAVRSAIESKGTMAMLVDEQAALTVSEIAARTRAARESFRKEGKTLDFVIVDHIGKIRPSGRYKGNRVHEVGEVSNALSEIAKNEQVALLALSQLNRSVESRENKRPGLSDLRESGDIEQDADLVMFAYRDAYYLERAKEEPGSDAEFLRQNRLEQKQNILEISIAKQRNGPTTTIELYCDMGSNVIRDLETMHV